MADTRPGRPRPLTMVACLAAAVVGGCAIPAVGPRADARPSPKALIDSYLIAHGMALGYGRSGRAGPAEISQLVQYDHAAMIAVATATLEPGRAQSSHAQSAVSGLVRYTGDQDLSTVPAPDAFDR